MKRKIIFISIVFFLLIIAACGNEAVNDEDTVTLRMPASHFRGQTETEVVQNAEENGITAKKIGMVHITIFIRGSIMTRS